MSVYVQAELFQGEMPSISGHAQAEFFQDKTLWTGLHLPGIGSADGVLADVLPDIGRSYVRFVFCQQLQCSCAFFAKNPRKCELSIEVGLMPFTAIFYGIKCFWKHPASASGMPVSDSSTKQY